MNELVDFEELIDVTTFLASVVDTTASQESSQEPLGDVLDKMCKALSENNLDIDNVETSEETKETFPDVIDLDEFKSFLADASVSKDGVEDVDKIDDVVNNLTTEGYMMNSIIPYEVPIYFGDIDATVTERVTNKLDKDEKIVNFSGPNELDTDKNIVSLLDLAVSYGNNAASSAVKDFNPGEMIEIKETADEVKEDEPEIIDLDAWKDIFTEPDSDDGYNSSDFEFISENEAIKGMVAKHDNETIYNPVDENKRSYGNVNSRPKNEASYSDYIKYSKYRYQRCYAQVSLEHHVVPDGEQYLDLFRGEYSHSPMIINNLHAKNKSIPPNMTMITMFDKHDLVFQISKDEDNEEHKEDADESAKLILSTYPGENRRKRRH